MEDNKFYFGVIAMLIAAFFFGFLVYTIWRNSLQSTVTAADIQKAREIVRRLEVER
jgi:hypothetical protein